MLNKNKGRKLEKEEYMGVMGNEMQTERPGGGNLE